MKVVLDSNIYISAAVFGGVPLQVLRRAERGDFDLYTSPSIQDEVQRVLQEKMGWPGRKVAEAFDPVWELSRIVCPRLRIHASRDDDDNHILECAVTCEADAVVTGDRDLLDLIDFEGIPIMTPRAFLDWLALRNVPE